MKALSYGELPTGWFIRIEFAERGKDRKRIVQDFFFPRIKATEANSVTGKVGDNQQFWEGVVHSFGTITLNEVIRFLPKFENIMQQAPLKESLKTGMVMEKIGQVVETDENGKPQFMIMGYREPITIVHPKNYIMTKDGWFPAVLSELQTEEKKEAGHALIGQAIALAKSAQEVFEALKTNTVKFLEPEQPKQYDTVPLPEAQGHTICISETGQIEPANARSSYRSVSRMVLRKWAKGKLDARKTKMAQYLGIVPV